MIACPRCTSCTVASVTLRPARAVCPSSNSTSIARISFFPEGWDQHVILSTRCEGRPEVDVSWKGEPPGPPIRGLLHLHMRWDSDAVSLAIDAMACAQHSG